MDRNRNVLWALLIPLGIFTGACSSGPGVKGKDGLGGAGGGTLTSSGPQFSLGDGGVGGDGAASNCHLGVTCASADAGCGPIGDGCGGTIQCGTCPAGTSCGGAGIPSQCGTKCVPTTCAALGATCGPTGDGCGGILDCGSCADLATRCQGIPSTCQPVAVDGGCTPATCTSLGANCGITGDGCGGTLNCGGGSGGVCPLGTQVCIGVPPTCQVPDAGPGGCPLVTCASSNTTCGQVGDGCGNSLDCGQCNPGYQCSGVPETCHALTYGTNPSDGGSICTGLTCTDVAANCGTIGDGCGKTFSCVNPITGTTACPPGQTCGGGGAHYQCGAPPIKCTTPNGLPLSCLAQTVGADGGAPIVNCGKMPDGCGGLIDCGSCAGNAVCGGNTPAAGGLPEIPGVANQCPQPPACTGLCLQQTTCTGAKCTQKACPAGQETIVTGTVYAPGHDDTATWGNPDPLNNVIVYIPNAAVQPFQQAVTCDQCNSEVSGAPLVQTITPDIMATGPAGAPAGDQLYVPGSFTLHDVPVGTNIPLVIQTGRWRRQFVIKQVTACTTTTVTAANLVQGPIGTGTSASTGTATTVRLPRTQAEGDIPHMALSTGSVDALECVLRKIGVADSEFTSSSGTGRIHLFQGNDGTTANTHTGAMAPTTTGTTQLEDVLVNSSPTVASAAGVALANYDTVLFACQGTPEEKSASQKANVLGYANAGGRVYATHYNYHWIYDNPSTTTGWATTGTWNPDPGNARLPTSPQTGYINYQTAAPTGATAGNAASITRVMGLANWLWETNVSTTFGQIQLAVLRNNIQGGLVPPSVDFIDLKDSKYGLVTMHYTFDTPLAPASPQCGRVLYDDFHVEDAQNTPTRNKVFPAECTASTMTPQEKLLEYMLFDLESSLPCPSTCKPQTCATQSIHCGPASDGCGNAVDCGGCPSGQVCGGCGTPGVCCPPACTPLTCASQKLSCGTTGDGCGGTLQCGTCASNELCGGCGVAGECCVPPCTTPSTCAAQGVHCGPAPDGCGNTLQCGNCPEGQTCGGGGVPGQCGAPDAGVCTSGTSCTAQGVTCGAAADGCGGVLDCGTCPVGQVCGGCGTPGQCCTPPCPAKTCTDQGIQCGPASNGCGTSIDCGTCPVGQTCGCSQPGVCGDCCQRTTCQAAGAECGIIGDGCGGTIDCGACPGIEICGAGTPAVPFKCGVNGVH